MTTTRQKYSSKVPVTVPRDLPRVLQDLGIKLGKETESEIWGLCPGHKTVTGKRDTKPTNWSINKRSGKSYCFACGYRADLVHIVMDLVPEARSNPFMAQRWLRTYGLRSVEEMEADLEAAQRERDVRFGVASYLSRIETEFAVLPDPPVEARKSRGVSLLACQHYDVRYRPEREQWVFPISDRDGKLLGWQEKHGPRMVNYPPSVRKSHYVFGFHLIEPEHAVIVVESPIDAVRLRTLGYMNAVSTMGSAVSDRQLRSLREVADSLILALDHDAPSATLSVLSRWGEAWVLSYEGTDANDPGEMTAEETHHALENLVHSLDYIAGQGA